MIRKHRRARGDATSRVAPAQPILEVDDLKTHFFTADGVVPAVDGVSYSVGAGETLGVVGESGCGKSVTALSIMRLVASPPGRIVGGAIRFDGTDLLELTEQEMEAYPRQRHLDDLPGADDLAQSVADRGPSDQRGDRAAPGLSRRDAMDKARGHAAPRAHSRAGAARAGLSAPAVRRHAPARDDRHGAVLQSEGADRRRADDRAGCHHPGADPRPDARTAGDVSARR